jgi:hypothetical protein
MKKKSLIELILTKFFIITLSVIIIGIALIYWFFISNKIIAIDSFNKLIDTVLKSLAIIIGFFWFLNRYYTERKDTHKFEITIDFNPIKLDSGKTLLIYRLDVYNKGNTLFDDYTYYLRIDGFRGENDNVIVEGVQVPSDNIHTGLPIEPNSWTAINNHLILKKEYKAIKFYIGIIKEKKQIWSWHKRYKLFS